MRIALIMTFTSFLGIWGCDSGCGTDIKYATTAIADTSTFYLAPDVDSVSIYVQYAYLPDTSHLLRIVDDLSLVDSCRIIAIGNSVTQGKALHYHDTTIQTGRQLLIQVGAAFPGSARSHGKGDAVECTPQPEHIETSSIQFRKPVARKLTISIY